MAGTQQEDLIKSLTKALSQSSERLPTNQANPDAKYLKSEPIKRQTPPRNAFAPKKTSQTIVRQNRTHDILVRPNAQKHQNQPRIASVPRPASTSKIRASPTLSSPAKKPPAPPPRARGTTQESENAPKSVFLNEREFTPKSTIPDLKKERSRGSQDPEEFYRSVRKLTQFTPVQGGFHKLHQEGIEDVTWTRFEAIFESIAGEDDNMQDLFDLCKYDYEVGVRQRPVDEKHRQFLESLLNDSRLNSFSRECVLCFVNNWKIVKGLLFDYSLDKGASGSSRRIVTVNVDKNKPLLILSPREEELDTEATTTCSIEPHIFNQSTDEAVSGVKEAMQQHIPEHLFKSLHGEMEQEGPPDNSYSYLEKSQPFKFSSSSRLSILCRELSFTAGIQEPFYCSLCLYDIRARSKLCETFHFELNQDEFLKLFKDELTIFSTVNRCLIPLGTHSRPDVYIVIRIDKLISNDIEKDFSKYQKKPGKRTSPLDQWKDLRFVRQPFVYSAVPLYQEDSKTLRSGSIVIDEFYPIRSMWTDDFIYDQLLTEMGGKKGKLITGNFTLEIETIDEIPPNTVDSSLNFITEQKATDLVKEVEWFGNKNYPFISYVNNLFVYPQTVQIKHHHPNIRVKVELLSDDIPNSAPLDAIYTVWGGKPFSTESYTAVCAKEKRPIFADEIKIQLPGVLTEKHHILFTIINHPNNEILGYAYTPIFSATHGIIKNALRTLVIEQQLEPGYLMKEVEPVKISETKKPYLCFKTCIISSIYPESNALFSLSHVLTRSGDVNMDGNPEQVLQVIQRLPPALCISFFPAILNCLFKLIASGDTKLAPLAVIGVMSVLTKVTKISGEKNTKCNSMLLSYVRYLFDPIMTAASTVHDSLVKYWYNFIEQNRPEVKNLGQGETWILLNAVLKSSIMKLCESGPPEKNARLTMFEPSYAESIEKLVLSLFCVETEIQNMDVLTMVPLFMKDLLGIIDRGVVFGMIFRYVCWLNNVNQEGDLFLATVKFTFIKIITNYKYYVPLNLPSATPIQPGQDINNVINQFWRKHFFSGLIVREVRAGLFETQRIREQSIALLLDLLHSHDIDPRYSDYKRKSRVVGLYFPFVITAVEYHQVLEEYLTPEEKINWLLCFFYIVENCSRTLLHQWWDASDAEGNTAFFKLLEMATVTFKEHSLYTPLCFIMVDMILDYITTYEKKLQEPTNTELPQIFAVLQELHHNQTVGFVVALYNLLAAVSKLFSKAIFCQANPAYCGSLTYQVLFHCNSSKIAVRNKACSLFYYLLKKNYEETEDVERMKLQSTISLCKLLSCEQKVKGYANLRNSLQVVQDYTQQEENQTIQEMIVGAVHQVSRLLRFNEQLSENEQNPQLMAELFIKIAHSYFHSPNLLMTWLEALAAHHKKSECWLESALVHIQLACIQVEYFSSFQQFPIDFYAFQSVYPQCKLNSIPADTNFSQDEFANCSLENIIKHLLCAVDLMKKISMFEAVLRLYSMLSEIYTAHSMLPELTECLADYCKTTTRLIKANKETRLFSTYFRVSFYGKKLGEEDGRQFIYRFEPKENLMTVQNFLKSILVKTYNVAEDSIVVLSNQAVDKSTLEDNVCYLQVASVTPYKDDAEKLPPHKLHFGVDKFLFESSIGKGDQQSKKKTIFKVPICFPYINSRIELTETEEIILTPLESAIDLIQDRIAKFIAALNVESHHDVRINQLQQLLQGSVVPMVNEGPLKICETYLKKGEREKHPETKISELEEAMKEFIKLCGFGVKLVNQVIELRQLSEYEQFQTMIEKHYEIMREKLRTYISE